MDFLIEFLASYLIWGLVVLVAVLVGLEIRKTKDFRKIGFIALAVLMAFMLDQVFHLLSIGFLRPYQILNVPALVPHPSDSPFPSDLAVVGASAALAVIFMTRYKKLGLLVLLLAILVMIGQLVALIHSPFDIFGGIFCAGVGALVWYYIYYNENLKKMPADIKHLVNRAKGKTKNLVGKIKK